MSKDKESNDVIAELATAIGAFASGDVEVGRGIVAAVAGRFSRQENLPGIEATASPTTRSHDAALKRVFRYWQERCGHEAAKLSPERASKILARLRQGYTELEIRKAIDGAAESAYVSPDGKRYDDVELICRNAAKLEDFIERGVRATGEVVPDAIATVVPGEDRISDIRRAMANLRKQGRDTEYAAAARELETLLQRRREQRSA